MIDPEHDVPDLLDEYMRLLGIQGGGPIVEIRDNLGVKWLGRTILRGQQVWIEIQARVLKDPRTFERVLAHEMIHYAEFLSYTDQDRQRVKLGIKGPEHGSSFWKLAEVVNEAKGSDFVTETSDTDYDLVENERPYFVVIEKVMRDRYAWRWAAKRTPAIDAKIARMVAGGAVLAETTSDLLLTGAKLGKGKIGSSLAKPGSDKENLLRELYEAGGGQ